MHDALVLSSLNSKMSIKIVWVILCATSTVYSHILHQRNQLNLNDQLDIFRSCNIDIIHAAVKDWVRLTK